MTPNKLAVYFVADMVFCCGRYRLAVADMVCGRYGRTPSSFTSLLYTTFVTPQHVYLSNVQVYIIHNVTGMNDVIRRLGLQKTMKMYL